MANQEVITIRKNPEKTLPYKRSLYTEFILWTAMPSQEKEELGIETQTQFAEYHKVNKDTLSEWKKRPDFEERVDAILKMWAVDKTPAVVHAIYRSALKGNPYSQTLWLQYFKKFNPKAIPEENKQRVLSPGDIRYMVDLLPEPMRTKHYGYLRELAEDVARVRNARGIDDYHWTERPTLAISDEADGVTPDVPDKERTDDVAKSYCGCACSNMVGALPQSNYQSAARWWEE